MKYPFGDIDGLWAAVLDRTAERRGELPSNAVCGDPLHERVATIVDTVYQGPTSNDSRVNFGAPDLSVG
ncbi:hypothetical protein MLAC_17090 [Mycobacterium lacus]|uniref:Uncharacterized protein n=1 Tax=Mycobacterium lacus TaxID=169765 RepID=A0A7I7NID2_9MYCO|nr:hypothetical protein MLAC_17090 [Mycobacterium lacus]